MIKIPTTQELYTQMRADAQIMLGSSKPIPTLSLLNVLITVFTGALRALYAHVYNIMMWILPDRATGDFLTRLVAIENVSVSIGTYAEGEVVFTGTAGVTIPMNTIVQTVSGISYATLAGVVIEPNGSSLKCPIQCTTLGTVGNFDGTQLSMPSPISQVDSVVTLVSPCEGGSNPDTESDLREKLLSRRVSPNTLGLYSDYERVALSVDGVGRIWVDGGTERVGPNVVEITVATRDNLPVSGSILTDVTELFHSDGKLMPGIVVDVKNIDIEPLTTIVSIAPDTLLNRTAVTEVLTDLLSAGIAPNEVLLLSQVQGALASAGLGDFVVTGFSWGGDSYPARNQVPPVGKKFSFGGVTFA